MSQADVDLLAKAYDQFRRGDIPAVLEKVDPEVVTERAAPLPDPVVYHGHEGRLRSLTEWTEDFEDFDLRADELFDEGDGPIVARAHVRDGRIAHLRSYSDRDAALDAARLAG